MHPSASNITSTSLPAPAEDSPEPRGYFFVGS